LRCPLSGTANLHFCAIVPPVEDERALTGEYMGKGTKEEHRDQLAELRAGWRITCL
jgi:hypothetical protein